MKRVGAFVIFVLIALALLGCTHVSEPTEQDEPVIAEIPDKLLLSYTVTENDYTHFESSLGVSVYEYRLSSEIKKPKSGRITAYYEGEPVILQSRLIETHYVYLNENGKAWYELLFLNYSNGTNEVILRTFKTGTFAFYIDTTTKQVI